MSIFKGFRSRIGCCQRPIAIKNIYIKIWLYYFRGNEMFVFVIKNIRLKQNMSLYRLSKITGISKAYLTELENNKKFNPTLKTMYSIANALNVKIDDLFYTLLDIEKLREEMHKKIALYGLDSLEVLEISQTIDLLINVDFSERNKNNEEQ